MTEMTTREIEVLHALDWNAEIPCQSPTHKESTPAVYVLYRVRCCSQVDRFPAWFACQSCMEYLLTTTSDYVASCGAVFSPRRTALLGWDLIKPGAAS